MRIIAALITAVLLLAGCSGSSDDAPAPAPEKTSASPDVQQAEEQTGVVIDIGLYSGRKPTPQGERVEAKVGEKITLRVTSAVDEELHVHSDPEHTFEVKPGKDQDFSFTVDAPGQVAVEAHHADVTIVQLVVRP